ncbi:MAG: Gfo/Idh/MocA family oxidoreductase [Ruminococcaceae bacterium]|nr:Gfo/Idh/MocA family oxidoreductase [Oscillospiraceae bacterium]
MKKIAFAGFRHGHIFALYNQVKECNDIELIGCWEEDAEAREAAEKNHGVVFNFATFEDVLNSDADIVAIGDYYGRRGELTIASLKAGKHVMADKPLCTSLEQLDEIEKLSKEKNLKVGCMLSLRYSKYTAVAKELISSGKLGDIHAISFNGQHGLDYGSRPMWYFEEGKHCGVINDISIHGVDLVEYLTGLKLKNVTAARTWNAFATEEPDFKDCAQFMAELDNGCGLMADISYAAPCHVEYGIPYYWQFLIWGSKGMIRFAEDGKPLEAYIDYAKEVQYIEGTECKNNHITDFIDEIDGKKDLLICTEEVLQSQRDTLTIQNVAN